MQEGYVVAILYICICSELWTIASLWKHIAVYPGPRDFLSPRREYQVTDKEAVREDLWLPVMRISLSCYDSCQSTSRDRLTSNQ